MTQIGDYKIIAKIAEGGMATVYKGLQVSLNRPVAVKVMSRDLAGDPDLVRRFDRESLITARLRHPNIIRVIDKGVTAANNAYFVMEFIDGTDLARLLRAGGMKLGRKLEVALQISKALSYAHKNGVIHRDIKPANILIDADQNVVVSDFGTAQLTAPDVTRVDLTQVGTVMGTLSYMSPEQRQDSSSVGSASDIFSFGVLLYEMFTGRRPEGRFQTPQELVPGLPSALSELILRCLENDPARRPNADDIRNRLLLLSQGRHLDPAQHEKAAIGMASLREQFLLLDVIKENPYGSVYLYEHRRSRALMVIKRLSAGQAGYEASKLLSTHRHEHMARVLGTARNKHNYIILTEYLRGGSLQEQLLQPMPVARALRVLREICMGLKFGHDLGLVHGNLRPSNVLFDDQGRVKLTDFGLEEHYGKRENADNWYNAHCQKRSRATDILAAGTLMHQMLCACLPVWGQDPAAGEGAFRRLPVGVQQLVRSMIESRPKRRYQSLEPVLLDIDRLLHERETDRVGTELGASGGSRRWWLWGAAALVLINLVGALVWQFGMDGASLPDVQKALLRFVSG